MKKFIILTAAALLLPLAAAAGDITPGSVPGNINYQGRLERDNAPITGTVHLYFRIYNSPTATGSGTCGAPAQPCLWESPEIAVQAAQGIFSADMTPPLALFGGGQKLYLEVQVEADVLTPREPLNSVAFALAAKRLEDGASVSVSSLTAAYQVLLATVPGSAVGVGTINPAAGAKMTVDGWLKINSGGIVFPDNSSMSASSIGSAGNISAVADAGILADSDGNNSGDIIFGVLAGERARITNAGAMGIGTPTPSGKLDVNGALYVGNEGIYDRTDSELNVKQDLVVEGGKVRGTGNNYISLGETANTIIAATNNTQRLWLDSSGNLGIGAAASASERVQSTGNIRSNTGVRGGSVSMGGYNGGWTGSANEVRADNNTNLLLQYTNPYNVGIGTDTPREKLHVHGSVRADYGIIAATAAFSSDVRVNGTFTANSGAGNTVNLSSTVIYGTLQVTGGIGSTAGPAAYITSSNTFTGHNTFQNGIDVSSDIITLNRIGAGVSDFDFAGTKYLQVGDNKPVFANDNAMLYLVGGSNAEAKINFYRGAAEAARLETQSGNSLPNLALVINNKARTITDSVYHRIQNSVVWISTGYNTTPAIFVSSSSAIVGIGTAVSDPNWRLTLEGNMRFSGSGTGIFFADGTSLTSGNLGALSVGNVSNNGDAVVQSDADQFAGGDVILRAGAVDGLILKSGGNVGIGTINPVSKLNIRGGDLVLGNPVNPYSGDSVEDLIVAGNIVFDGALVQRSAQQVQISGLMVASDVYLSTAAGARTGIGTKSPATTLDANGSAQFGSGTTKSTFTASGVLQLAAPLTVPYGGTGMSSYTIGDIAYASGSGTLNGLADVGAGSAVISGGVGAAPTYGKIGLTTHVSGTLPIANGGTNSAAALSGSSIMVSNGSAIVQGATGGAATVLHGNLAYSAVSLVNDITGTLGVGNGGTGADLSAVATGGLIYKSAAGALGGTGALYGVVKANNGGVPTVMTGTANTLTKWTDNYTVGNSIITDDGTTVNVNTHKIINVTDPGSAQDAATKNYVDSQLTGLGTTWSRTGNSILGTDWLGSSNAQSLVIKTGGTTAMTITTGQIVQLANALGVAYGGTGATTAGAALTSLGAAARGANSDITSLTGLTTALSVPQGGTGATTAGAALTSLGAAARGANSDISSITGLAGAMRLYSRNMAQLLGITPAVGDVYYCSDCSPAKVVVATGTSSGNFADATGGTFK